MQEVVDVYPSESKVDKWALKAWSYDELKCAGLCTETRNVKNVAKRVCTDVDNSPLLVLVVEGKRTWFRRPAMSLYTCGGF